MSTDYLRNFVDGVTDVPAKLQRTFKGIRELDSRVAVISRELERDRAAQLQLLAEEDGAAPPTKGAAAKRGRGGSVKVGAVTPPASTAALAARVTARSAELLRLSSEKTDSAQQAYDLVDGIIRRLDQDLEAFDAELAEAAGVGPGGSEVGSKVGHGGRGGRRGGAPLTVPGAPEPQSQPMSDEEAYQQALATADPSDPTYCTCKRINFGEMVACDNPDCAIEWFHLSCVGLTPETKPVGKWYCEDCRKLSGLSA